jgi:tetratricopeptide (TPR) repeat protein
MRIVFTLFVPLFAAAMVCAQQPPEAPSAPEFPAFPLSLAFQDSTHASDQQARRMQEQSAASYARGKNYLDRKQYDNAIDAFSRVIENKGTQADGAYYWRAYALNKLARRQEALASLDELQKAYPASRWLDDAKALRVEIGSANGQPVSPESASDEDLKLLALNSLMNTDPERSVPMLEKLLQGNSSPRIKERALFVLAQSHSPEAQSRLAAIAKGGSNPDLQSKAIEYLGIYGGRDNLQLLLDIYKNSRDEQVKRRILNSFMVAGSRDNLLAAAKTESNPELKVHAIQLLGSVGDSADLAQLYSAGAPQEVKRAVLQGLMIAGNADKILEIAKTEKDESLRRSAINQLGVMGRERTGAALQSMYTQETNADNKKAIVNALFIQGNATALIAMARKETNLDLKKDIVSKLSLMHSKEAMDYLMEILTK